MLSQKEGTSFAKSQRQGRAVSFTVACGGAREKGPVERPTQVRP